MNLRDLQQLETTHPNQIIKILKNHTTYKKQQNIEIPEVLQANLDTLLTTLNKTKNILPYKFRHLIIMLLIFLLIIILILIRFFSSSLILSIYIIYVIPLYICLLCSLHNFFISFYEKKIDKILKKNRNYFRRRNFCFKKIVGNYSEIFLVIYKIDLEYEHNGESFYKEIPIVLVQNGNLENMQFFGDEKIEDSNVVVYKTPDDVDMVLDCDSDLEALSFENKRFEEK